jgi:hypothetical protein
MKESDIGNVYAFPVSLFEEALPNINVFEFFQNYKKK